MGKFAREDLDRFSSRDVLVAFGLPARERGPCPLCLTSDASQAFAVHGVFWHCHACQRSGNQVGLYAALGGCSRGQAVGAIATALGLDPADGVSSRRAREAALSAQAARDRAERLARARWQGAMLRRDLLRAAIAEARPTPLSWDMLRGLYDRL